MPAAKPEELIAAIIEALRESGCNGSMVSSIRRQPRRFIVTGQNVPSTLTVYA